MRLILQNSKFLTFNLSIRPSFHQLNKFNFNTNTADNPQLKSRSLKVKNVNLTEFTPDKIRNFIIIAHIDHGKSTLSDRFLEETNLISKDANIEQYTDKLQIEKQRGITVRSTTVSLIHKYKDENYLLNLIDSPGHVDFSPEVYRSMPVCQGAILLVDATKGIQAQTISHFNKALLSDLLMIPVLNKIDVSFSKPKEVIEQMKEIFAFDKEEIFQISAKTGENVPVLLDKIVELIPPPPPNELNKPFEAIVFDSWHLANDGVLCLINVRNGQILVGDKIKFFQDPSKVFEVRKLAIFHPDEVQVDSLQTGQFGIVTAFIHDLNFVQLGDILFKEQDTFPDDYQNLIPPTKQMVYASFFPYDPSEASNLKQAIKKIHLTDKSVEIEPDVNQALGVGFRLGFQGLLHMDVFSQRLDMDFDSPVVVTSPSVNYKVQIKGTNKTQIKAYGTDTIYVRSAWKLPDKFSIERVEEPMVKATIITPNKHIDALDALTRERRGVKLSTKFIDQNNVLMENRYPLSEVITDFLDILKTITSGYASFDSEPDGYQKTEIVVLRFTINKEALDELTMIVPRSKSRELAKTYCERIKKSLKNQLYDVVIHGLINSKIICKEEIKATGKDVLGGKLHGADLSRKAKLTKNQEEGRKRLRVVGKIPISRDLLIDVLRKN